MGKMADTGKEGGQSVLARVAREREKKKRDLTRRSLGAHERRDVRHGCTLHVLAQQSSAGQTI